jgi:chemotaxis protein MotA
MFVIIGFVVVLGSVLGGFALAGGHFLVLMQWAEFIIIGGSAVGALLVSTPPAILKRIVQATLGAIKGKGTSKESYLSVLKLLFDLLTKGQKEGWIALEKHIENPAESPVFTAYPDLMQNSTLVCFITDTFRMVIMGGISAHDLEALMEADIETQFHDGKKPGMIIQKIGDALPGLGIVAAVLGIIITMGAINGPADEIGHKVGAALVGTFLGILLSYGFLQPLATNIDLNAEKELVIFEVLKHAITGFAKGLRPILCVEFARRSIPAEVRPGFEEMESFVKGK